MTITSDKIKLAFSRITKAKAGTAPVLVDAEKMVSSVIDQTTTFTEAEDPMTKLDDLAKSVEEIETMLDGATENEDGTILIKAEHADLGKQFAPDAVEAPEVETSTEKTGDETDEGDDEIETEKADLSDDIKWDNDLSPTHPPTLNSERLTKGERAGSPSRLAKMAEKRDKALARRDERRSVGSSRTLS